MANNSSNITSQEVHGGFNKSTIRNQAWMLGSQYEAPNPMNGGQFGFMTDFNNYINTTPYLQQPVKPFLLQYPGAFDLFDQETRDVLVKMLKNLMEVAPKEIEGLRSTISTDTYSMEMGAYQVYDEINNVTRERSAPTNSYVEVDGCTIGRFWEWYIETLGMDANSKYPNIITLQGLSRKDGGRIYQGKGAGARQRIITTFLSDMTKMVMLYVEPDRTGQYCVDAYLCANMFPKGAGDRESRRSLTSSKAGREFTVEFTAITQIGYGVIALGQRFLDVINYTGCNPQLQPAAVIGKGNVNMDLDKIRNGNITNAGSGYTDGIARLGQTALSL